MENPYQVPSARLSNAESNGMWYLLFSFDGRIDRRNFWAGLAVVLIASSLLVFAPRLLLPTDSYWHLLTSGVMLYPLFAVTTKRYHDQGKSGWLSLIWLAPFVGWMFAVIECGFSQGDLISNKYGAPLHGRVAELKRKQ